MILKLICLIIVSICVGFSFAGTLFYKNNNRLYIFGTIFFFIVLILDIITLIA